MAIAWAIAVASALAGAVRVDGGARAEGRSRTVDAEGAERTTVAEVAVTPRLGAELAGPDLDVRAQYAATLRAPDVLTSVSPDVLHVAELRARWRLHPVWSLAAAAAAERGTTDLVTESRRRQELPEAIPTTAQLRYAGLRGDLALEGSLDPRTRLSFTGGAFVSGGDDEASREILPLERGARAGVGVEWGATRRDVLALSAAATGARFQGSREAALASLTAGWRRSLAPTVDGTLRAGAVASYSGAPGEEPQRALLPTGEAALAHASERLHLREDLALRVGAGVDRVRGTVERLVELAGALRWAPAPTWSISGRASAALVRQGPARTQRGAAELRAEWSVLPELVAGVGAYGQWQRSDAPAYGAPPPLPSFVEGGGFLSVSVDLPRLVR